MSLVQLILIAATSFHVLAKEPYWTPIFNQIDSLSCDANIYTSPGNILYHRDGAYPGDNWMEYTWDQKNWTTLVDYAYQSVDTYLVGGTDPFGSGMFLSISKHTGKTRLCSYYRNRPGSECTWVDYTEFRNSAVCTVKLKDV